MAVLEKIRSRAGLLIAIVIGVALFAFVLSDLLQSGGSIFSGDRYNIAEVAGKTIELQQYQDKVNEMVENTKKNQQKSEIDDATYESIRDQAWEQLIKQYVMENQFQELGISVHADELFDMVQGNNIHPQVKQIPIFLNQNTKQFDRNLVIDFLKKMDKDETGVARSSWLAFEEALVQERFSAKYNNLIKKGLYTTSYQAKQEVAEKNLKIDLKYIAENYTGISDSAVTATESEIKQYYDEHIQNYEQETSRDLEYVAFDVKPSNEDIKAVEENLVNLKNDFTTSTENKQFINANSDVFFEDNYNKKGELPVIIDSLMFAAQEGFVYGPYIDNNAFKLTKLLKILMLPDTVKASHILIKPEEKEGGYEMAKAKVDSLKKLVEQGVSFAELAAKFGTDGTKDKGGDLGWFKYNGMVKPFNDTCFFAKKGDLRIAETQFGVHLILVTDRGPEVKKVEIGTIENQLKPSEKTRSGVYSKANLFAGKNNTTEKFEVAVNEQNLVKRVAPNLKEMEKTISGLERGMDSPRDIVKWAYEVEKGTVSRVFDLDNKFVVAVLKEVREKGPAALAQVKNEIEMQVKKDKKAAQLKEKLNTELKNNASLEAVAQKLNLKVDTIQSLNFSAYSVPKVGFEPEIIGVATCFEKNKVSKPIKGNTGVYVIDIFNSTVGTETNEATEKERMTSMGQSRVDYQVYEALKEYAKIKDQRSKFF